MKQYLVMTAVALLATLPAMPAAAEFSADEQHMIEWIDAHAEEAIALLAETVNIGSGTMNLDGVQRVGAVMRRELDALGLDTEWIEMPPDVRRAGHLVGRKDGEGKRFLLIGHLDTVYESDAGQAGFRRDGDMGFGPGIDDMKSGNAIIVYALKALAEIGMLGDLPVTVVYTGDEEYAGIPLDVTRGDLIRAAEWADIALGFEGAVTREGSDWATISRRSSSIWTLEVTGKQAHSSGIFDEDVGAGAIHEAARIIDAFYNELRGEEYLTFNAGVILGGTDVEYDVDANRGTAFGKLNVVPQKVIVHGDIRTISQQQLDSVRERMLAIAARSLPVTEATLSFRDKYPAMAPTPGNEQLAALLSAINEDLGRGPMRILDPMQRGAADISFAAAYTDALAGLGALGRGAHSPDESLDLTSLPLAIKRAALLIYRLRQQDGG